MSDDEKEWNDKRITLEHSIGSLLDELFAHAGTDAMKMRTPNGVEYQTEEYDKYLSPKTNDITSTNYVENATRTESNDFDAIASRMCDPNTIRLLHSAMGLSTEAGEFLDMLKKHIFYGKELDLTNAKEEIGDSMWYVAISIDVLQTTLNDVMQVNINKLRERYPEKFTSEDALCRDLGAERKILEDL